MYQGGEGVMNGQFHEPRGMVQDTEGNIYVIDTWNHRVQVFNENGAYLWQTGEEGDGEGEFKEPNDIAFDPQTGRIYVSDTWNHRIVVLDKNGTFLGSAPLGFYGQRGIAFHPQTRLLYIADTGNSQVKIMNQEGKLIRTWGTKKGDSEDSFNEPVGIAVTPKGNLVILDSLNKRVKEYRTNGTVVQIWPVETEWENQGGFEGHLACSPDGTIYLTDPIGRCVYVYNPEGERIEILTKGLGGRKLLRPTGILCTQKGKS